MTKIDTLWREMEADQSANQGLLLRRYAGTVLPDLYLALKTPERVRGIAAAVPSGNRLSIDAFSVLQDIKVELRGSYNNTEMLLISLHNPLLTDLFSVLCEDLIYNVADVTTQTQLLRELLNRLARWQALLDKASSGGLSGEEQRGLFGELCFLHKLLAAHPKQIYDCVACWRGPQREEKDFRHGNWALEVKTTFGNSRQAVLISSERQLDRSGLDRFWLYHVSLQETHPSRGNLNQLIEETKELLKDDFRALALFQNRLAEGGYFRNHAPLYQERGYAVQNDAFYRITGNFPRIEARNIPIGVSEVKYTLNLPSCEEYRSAEQEVLNEITFL